MVFADLPSICTTIYDGISSTVHRVLSKTNSHWHAILLIGVATLLVFSFLRRRRGPPGPPRLPILGNILQFPVQLPFIKFTEWSRKYGPIYSLDLLGQQVVVLNNYKTAGDLLNRCSSIYNARTRQVMANEILCGGTLMPLVGDTDLWRRWRRSTHESFGPKGVMKYQSVQAEAAALAMLRTITNPDAWEKNLEVMSASGIFSTVYGWPALGSDTHTPEIKYIYDLAYRISGAAVPGTFLVDFFPIMNYLPAWMARWKREGNQWHNEMSKIFDDFHTDAKRKMLVDEAQTNYASDLLRTQQQHKFSDKEVAWIPAVMLAAGAETTSTTLINFILAMVNYPDVMQKAQAELDSVVGRERSPTFDDADALPYIRAIVQETLRWRPVSPLTLPHVATEDNWYEGYYLPKGTIFFGNIWAMNRDPAIHPDFDVFKPERFLDGSGMEVSILADAHRMGHTSFGFGRRICVGMHFAEQALFIAIATALWALDIRPTTDETGNILIPPTNDWVHVGTVVRPAPFKCRILPRFPEAQAVLEASTSHL